MRILSGSIQWIAPACLLRPSHAPIMTPQLKELQPGPPFNQITMVSGTACVVGSNNQNIISPRRSSWLLGSVPARREVQEKKMRKFLNTCISNQSQWMDTVNTTYHTSFRQICCSVVRALPTWSPTNLPWSCLSSTRYLHRRRRQDRQGQRGLSVEEVVVVVEGEVARATCYYWW